MRRSLLVTAAAAISMVLLAMLVPMAILVRSYALEDRLARAALEVQAVESVVSRYDDMGSVAVYVDRINDDDGHTQVTVLYPDGTGVGPDPGEDARVLDARNTGRARVDDVARGSQILVPVSRGGNSALPSQTPVIRVVVDEPGLTSVVGVAWGLLALLALALLAGSLVVVDRLGRSFVQPIRQLAEHTQTLGRPGAVAPLAAIEGPPEVQELAGAVDRLVGRIELLLARERESVADLSHRLRTPVTALRLRVEAVDDPQLRGRLGSDLDALQATVDEIVRDARRSEREGLDPRTDAVAVMADRVRHWAPLAEDLGRPYDLDLADHRAAPARQPRRPGGARRRAAGQRLLPHRRHRRRPRHPQRLRRRGRAGRRGRRSRPAARPRRHRTRGQRHRVHRARAVHRRAHRGGLRRGGGHGPLGHGRSPGRRHVADGLTRAPGACVLRLLCCWLSAG